MTLTLDQLSQSQNMFKPTAKKVELLVRDGAGEIKHMVASFRKECYTQSWSYPKEYLIVLAPEDVPVYDQLLHRKA